MTNDLFLMLIASFLLMCINGRWRKDRFGLDLTMRHPNAGGVNNYQMAVHCGTWLASMITLLSSRFEVGLILAIMSLALGVTWCVTYCLFGPFEEAPKEDHRWINIVGEVGLGILSIVFAIFLAHLVMVFTVVDSRFGLRFKHFHNGLSCALGLVFRVPFSVLYGLLNNGRGPVYYNR